jgi:hypothetical protein
VGEEEAVREATPHELEHHVDVLRRGTAAHAVELHPGPRPGKPLAHGAIAYAIGVHNDQSIGARALARHGLEHLQGRGALAGVAGNRQARREVRSRRSHRQFAIDVAQRSRVDADFDEPRANARPLDPVAPLGDPALGELCCGSR